MLFIFVNLGNTLEINDFYEYDNSFLLENGADKSGYRKLPKSLNFFSDIYDHIYVSFSIISILLNRMKLNISRLSFNCKIARKTKT